MSASEDVSDAMESLERVREGGSPALRRCAPNDIVGTVVGDMGIASCKGALVGPDGFCGMVFESVSLNPMNEPLEDASAGALLAAVISKGSSS